MESYVFANDTLMVLKNLSSPNLVTIPFDGKIFSISVTKGQIVKSGALLFKVQKSENISDFSSLAFEYNKKKLHDTAITFIIDDFTKEKSIAFSRIAGQDTNYFDIYSDSEFPYSLGLTFENNNGFAYMKFLSISPSFTLTKGDSIILLFEDDTTINYKFQLKGNVQKIYGGSIYSNIRPITIDDVVV